MTRWIYRVGWAVTIVIAVGDWRGAAAGEAGIDLRPILSGVRQIGAPGIPGPLCVFGPQAQPAIVAKISKDRLAAVVAAAQVGKGRVVAFGHPGYLDGKALQEADTGRLMTNAIAWSCRQDPSARGKIRVVTVRRASLVQYLKAQGFSAVDVDLRGLSAALASADVVALDVADLKTARAAEAMLKYVERGHGMIAASLGWGWAQLNPTKSLVEDHPGNCWLSAVGIAWADGYLSRTGEVGYAVQGEPSPLLHAGQALQAIVAHDRQAKRLDKAELAQATSTVSLAVRTLRADEQAAFAPLRAWASQRAAELVPTHKRPIGADDGLRRLALVLQTVESRRLPAEKIGAHPAAAVFPGAVAADAPRVRRTVSLSAVPGWQSTGLYAPPGGVIDVALPDSAAGKGIAVRIGCHSDVLWDLDKWRRCPEISMRRSLDERITRIASPFGGLIYLEAPARGDVGKVAIGVQGAVEAPYYVLGTTTAADWKTIRRRPAPWAELASERVIVTVPAEFVRELEDPQGLMEAWNQVLDACADLAAIPRERRRPERYVADEQISAGYMHSGYPIMTHLDAAPSMAHRDRLLAGNWGLFHEMGHNHQSGDWTFDGTGEVTCNLFSLYVGQTVCRLNDPGHRAVQLGEARDKAYRKYAASGPDFAQWKADPFLALTMYVQLREAFGWDAYKKVFAEYRQLAPDQRPRNDAEKRDQWMVRFSRAAGRNLGPFFQAWGVPVSPSACAAVAGLPAWMPDGFPPK